MGGYWKAIVLSKLGFSFFFRDRKQYQKEKTRSSIIKERLEGDSSAVLDNLQIVSRECPGEWRMQIQRDHFRGKSGMMDRHRGRRVSNEREIEAQGGKNREEDAASGTLSKKDPTDQIII